MTSHITTLNRRIEELEEAHGDVIASLRDGDVKKALEVATKAILTPARSTAEQIGQGKE